MNWRCARANLLLAATVVTFKAADGVSLQADYAAPAKGRPVAVMVHGVAAGRGEYEAFASTMQARGWGTLALDLRYHGELSYGKDVDWMKARKDIVAAARFLKNKGVPEDRVVLIGASIGANLCSQAVADLPKIRSLVLLSPGADYRGVGLSRFPARTLAAASPPDGYAYATVQKVHSLLSNVEVLDAKSGHGAQMFADADFTRALVDWLGK